MTQTQYKLKHFMLWDSADLIWSSVHDAVRTRMLPCFNLKFCLGYLGSILSHCLLILKKTHFARNNLSTVVAKITMLNVYLLEQSEESCLSLTAFLRKKDSEI